MSPLEYSVRSTPRTRRITLRVIPGQGLVVSVPTRFLRRDIPALVEQHRAWAEAALADLRKRVEADATYVGGTFAAEARAMHAGEKPGKAIWGEANAKDAMALIADGVPVAPLPFHPRAKVN